MLDYKPAKLWTKIVIDNIWAILTDLGLDIFEKFFAEK